MTKQQQPHPDDFMIINIGMAFRAKVNPEADDPPPIDIVETEVCLPAEDETADYLEAIAKAIRERRLYGFVQQEMASFPVSCGEWIEKSVQDIVAEMKEQSDNFRLAAPVVKLSDRHKPKKD